MKTQQPKLIATMMLFGLLFFANTTKAQETKKVYYFGMSVLKGRNFAVTPVITSNILVTNYTSTCRSQLEKYLMDYIPAETNYEIDWSNRSTASSSLSGTSYSDTSETRLQFIKKYKDWGYNIVNLNNIDFRCDQ